MTRETSKSVARLAGRVLAGHKPTRAEIESLAASALAQAEIEQESVKVWGMERDGTLMPGAALDKRYIEECHVQIPGDKVIPVLIRRVRPARADKRIQARKRGK